MKKTAKTSSTKSNHMRMYFFLSGVLLIVQFIVGLIYYDFSHNTLVRYVGMALWVFILITGWIPIATLRLKGDVQPGNKLNTQSLVTSGVYAVVRHPQYVSFMLISISLMLMSQHWLVVLIGIVAILLFYVVIQEEERYLTKKFGTAYKKYQNDVPQINFIWGFMRLFVRQLENLIGE